MSRLQTAPAQQAPLLPFASGLRARAFARLSQLFCTSNTVQRFTSQTARPLISSFSNSSNLLMCNYTRSFFATDDTASLLILARQHLSTSADEDKSGAAQLTVSLLGPRRLRSTRGSNRNGYYAHSKREPALAIKYLSISARDCKGGMNGPRSLLP